LERNQQLQKKGNKSDRANNQTSPLTRQTNISFIHVHNRATNNVNENQPTIPMNIQPTIKVTTATTALPDQATRSKEKSKKLTK
jgi:hypothetical protein